MGRLAALMVLVSWLTLTSCGSEDGTAADTRGALSCTGNSNLAMLWGLIESGTFLNPSELPTPAPGWVSYLHPSWPLLSFLHPPDWTPTTLASSQAVGVDLLRNDTGGLYHNLGAWDTSGVAIEDWLGETIDRSLTLMNAEGTATVLCSLPATTRPTTHRYPAGDRARRSGVRIEPGACGGRAAANSRRRRGA